MTGLRKIKASTTHKYFHVAHEGPQIEEMVA